jgi:hypothetical protein
MFWPIKVFISNSTLFMGHPQYMGAGGIAVCILNLYTVFVWLVVFAPWQLLVGKEPPISNGESTG